MKALILAAVLAFVLPACAQLGVPTPDTFNEKLAVAYTTVTTARQSATTLLQAKKITPDDAQHVLDQTNNARAGLDVARQLSKQDLKAADGKLTAIRSALEALQAYLASRQGG